MTPFCDSTPILRWSLHSAHDYRNQLDADVLAGYRQLPAQTRRALRAELTGRDVLAVTVPAAQLQALHGEPGDGRRPFVIVASRTHRRTGVRYLTLAVGRGATQRDLQQFDPERDPALLLDVDPAVQPALAAAAGRAQILVVQAEAAPFGIAQDGNLLVRTSSLLCRYDNSAVADQLAACSR